MSEETRERAFLKPIEIAEELGVDRSTVYNWIKSRKLLAIQAGPTTKRVPRAAYEAFVRRMDGQEVVRVVDPRSGVAVLESLSEVVARGGEALEPALVEFENEAGMSPEAFCEAWKHGAIEDEPASAQLAIRALALREARIAQLA